MVEQKVIELMIRKMVELLQDAILLLTFRYNHNNEGGKHSAVKRRQIKRWK